MRTAGGAARLGLSCQKRLVQHVPNRGYHVFLPDGDRTAHILELRVILETAAVDSIVAQSTPATIERIRNLARRFDETILTGTILDQYEANLAFHRELLGLCPNPELLTSSRSFAAERHRHWRGNGARGLASSNRAASIMTWWTRSPPGMPRD